MTGCVASRLQLRPVAGSFASTDGLDVSFFSASCLVALSENRVRQIQSLIIIIFHDNICHNIYIYVYCVYSYTSSTAQGGGGSFKDRML